MSAIFLLIALPRFRGPLKQPDATPHVWQLDHIPSPAAVGPRDNRYETPDRRVGDPTPVPRLRDGTPYRVHQPLKLFVSEAPLASPKLVKRLTQLQRQPTSFTVDSTAGSITCQQAHRQARIRQAYAPLQSET